jgi:hypothetical protein
MYNRKQTFMSLSFSTNTQRTTQTMNLNQSFLLIQMSVHGCFYTALCFFLLQMLLNNVTMHNEGVYIPFPSCALQLSSLELNSIYFTLTILNVVYLLRTRAIRSRSIYNIQVRLILMAHLRFAQQFQSVFKICAGLSSCPPLPRWLA